MGGQKSFLNKYIEDPESYFSNSDIVLFVVDASEVEKIDESRKIFHEIVTLLKEKELLNDLLNLKKNIVCLFHKMDNFPNRREKYLSLKSYFKENAERPELMKSVSFLATSIYDSSIHTAWTKVMQKLMPKSSKLNILAQNLKKDINL